MPPTRRRFLASALAFGAAPLAARAIDPIQRPKPARMRLSLAAYSFRKYLDLKKPMMDLEGFIDFAAAQDLDAVELTSYYFADTSPEYLARLKGRCTRLGLDVSGAAVGNDFCTVDPKRRQEQIAQVKAWTDRTAALGGKTLRIFAGAVPKGDDEEKARARCVEAIHEACDHAAKVGVYLALENHGGITATPDQLLAIVKAVKHDWFGVNLDSGNFRTADPYADLERIAPYAINVQIKTEIQRAGKPKEPADLARLVGMLKQVGYRGYVALEHEAAEEPKEAVPRHLKALRKLIGEGA